VSAPLPTRSETRPAPRTAPTGVLLVNLGTPDAPEPAAVRRYLREFLGDPRVVDVPRPLWTLILNAVVLPVRGGRSAAAYAKVWTEEGSPLLRHTRAAACALAGRLGEAFLVRVGMRYGNPGHARALEELVGAGCGTIVGVPLFPQASDTTTGSVYAAVHAWVGRRRDPPALRWVPPFYDDPGYVAALAARVREAVGNAPVDHYLFSFHGLPERYVRAGDPYLDHCTLTSWALADALGLERDRWEMVFQSRFGREPWLQPYLSEYAPARARAGDRRLCVVSPAFVADCLETIEEVGIALRADVEAAGGELIVVPAPNDAPEWVDALEALVRRAAG